MASDRVRALGGKMAKKDVLADLERYRQLALDLGAAASVVISAGSVVVDERVRLKCTVPRCARAGETPNCPPYAPSLELVRKALSRYHHAVLFKCSVEPLEDFVPRKGATPEERQRALSFHESSARIVCELEREAYKDGYHLVMGFGGGSCKDYLCKGLICQYLDSGRCRFPHRARPAMEAVGIDVFDLVNQVGWKGYALVDGLGDIPCAITAGIVFVY